VEFRVESPAKSGYFVCTYWLRVEDTVPEIVVFLLLFTVIANTGFRLLSDIRLDKHLDTVLELTGFDGDDHGVDTVEYFRDVVC